MSPVAHHIFGFALLRFFLWIVVARTHSADGHRHNRAGNYFHLLNTCVKKHHKVWKLLFFLLQVVDMRLVKEDPGMSIKLFTWEKEPGLYSFLTITSAAWIMREMSSSKSVEAWVINGHDDKIICRWIFPRQLHKKRKHTLFLDRHLVNTNIMFQRHSRVGS